MKQLTKVNQDNKLLKKAYDKKVQQNLALVAKAETSYKDPGTKVATIGKNKLWK